MLLIHAMSDTAEAFNEGRLDSLLPLRKGFLIVTTGRLGEGNMSRLFGVSHLPILMPKSRVAYLYMMLAHRGESGLSGTAVEHHRGVSGTLARSRTYVWIVRGKNLAKQIVSKCPQCIRDRKCLFKQQMGMMREAQLFVCPPWKYVTLNFACPVLVGGEVKKRIHMKTSILVYVD